MSVVTTSRRRPPRRVPLPAILVLAAVLLAALALCLLREGRASSRPPSTPPREGPASSGPQEGATSVPAAPAATPPSILQTSNSSTRASAEDEPASPDTPPKPQKHFPRPTEQLLAIMLSTPQTIEMAPLPELSPDDAQLNADAILGLTNDLVIYETDDERLVALKETVAELKRQLADAVKNGGNVADVLNEFRNWQNEGVKVRNDTIKAINSIEDDQAAAETFKKANEELVKEDIPPIKPEEVGFEVEEPSGE